LTGYAKQIGDEIEGLALGELADFVERKLDGECQAS